MFETLESPQTDRVESTFLIDLRGQPRFDTHFPGEMFAGNGEHVYVTITNVSLSGLRLEGRRETVDALLDNLHRRTPNMGSHTSLNVHFLVPNDSEEFVPVKVHCKALYTRRAERDTYQIGMKFVTFEEGRAALAEYLSYREATPGWQTHQLSAVGQRERQVFPDWRPLRLGRRIALRSRLKRLVRWVIFLRRT